ncbi:hypothetical protein QC763_607370 [Podospora pseudopauciseta]|uniref:Protein HRI1 n=1 Tax=Podospora pseudopauciseta TaxID=2093780 RepID=A0ABR0H616_9PEZI|nr:hypothetical protein QC763_607370 [Podospora pseudopauciseta]
MASPQELSSAEEDKLLDIQLSSAEEDNLLDLPSPEIFSETPTHQSNSPLTIADLKPGTPLLSVQLSAPQTTPLKTNFAITLKITYTGLLLNPDKTTAPTTRPITFRPWTIIGWHQTEPQREGFWLYRHRPINNNNHDNPWEFTEMDDGTICTFAIYDDPDKEVPVSKGNHLTNSFISLRPGETWTWEETLQQEYWSLLPDDAVPADRFRFCFKGAYVDWWDWGDLEEHKQAGTTVLLPCFEGARSIERETDKKMPVLVVPGAEEGVEFVIVDGSTQEDSGGLTSEISEGMESPVKRI